MPFVKVTASFGEVRATEGIYSETSTGVWDQISPANGYSLEYDSTNWFLLLSATSIAQDDASGDDTSPATGVWTGYTVEDYAAPGEITDTPASPSSPGELPSIGGGSSVVTSPGSITPQAPGSPTAPGAVSPVAPGPVLNPDGYVWTTTQNLTSGQQDQVAANLGTDARYLAVGLSQSLTPAAQNQGRKNLGTSPPDVYLANTLSRVNDMNNPLYVGGSFNHLTVFMSGDSLGELGVWPALRALLEERMSRVGIGIDSVKYVTQSGTVTEGTTEARNGEEYWGSGRVRTLASGAILRMGDQDEDGNIIPFLCTDASFYFPVVAGAGEVLIETSTDEGATWSTIEAAVDTSTGTNVIVHTETFSELPRLFRLTATAGPVEFIGCLLRNKNRKGLTSVLSQRGGNGFHQFIEASADILNAVMADIAPTVVLTQYLEGPTGMAAFGTYADRIETAAPDADHLVMIDYERDGNNTAENTLAPIYRTEAARVQDLQVFETGKVLPWEVIDSYDWTTADPVHLDPKAWNFVASVMAPIFGAEAVVGNMAFLHVNQTAGLDRYETPKSTNNRILSFSTFQEQTDIFRWSWDAANLGENYYQFERVRSGDSNNPLGFHLESKIGSGVWHFTQWTQDGKIYHGKTSGSTTIDASVLDARLTVSGVSTDSATLTLGHNTASRDLIRFKNTAGTTVATIDNSGKADFASYEIPSYADDAAADADSTLASGALYKLTGSRAVYQKP